MAKAMEHRNQTKQERRRAAAEAREALRRRQAQRRTLGYALGGVALIVMVVLVVLASMGGDQAPSSEAVNPSRPADVTTSGSARPGDPLRAGETVPDFSAPAIGGGTFRWSDYAGGPTVLSVWAPWCPHCQAELPRLNAVMKEFPGVQFATVVTGIGDQPGPDPGVFLEDNGITAPTAIDDSTQKLGSALGIEFFPTLYFVGSDGNVVRYLTGEVEDATLRNVIGSLG
jgi:thiol-disulfide isomerase/thioredoxin